MTPLHISMATYGVLASVSGLFTMLFPGPLIALGGGAGNNTFLLGSWGWLTALIGLGILQASRDPIRHILWLRIALVSFAVGGAYDLFHLLVGTVGLGAIATDLIAYAIFGSLFLFFFPRTPRMVPVNVMASEGPLYTDADQGGLFLQQNETYVAYYLPLKESASPLTIMTNITTSSVPNEEQAPLPTEETATQPEEEQS